MVGERRVDGDPGADHHGPHVRADFGDLADELVAQS
jgi:hypothetical protein